MSLHQWHRRYQQQAHWTASIREYLFQQASIQPDDRILEVGVGTGAVLNTLTKDQHITPFGADIDHAALKYAMEHGQSLHLVEGDGNLLPLPNDGFHISYCHYLLLWVKDPLRILSEMKRVTQPGGFVMALAEPDHDSRIDYPPLLDELGQLQTKALEDQGADTALGRKLRALFENSGLSEIEAGVLGAQWTEAQSHPEESEWMTIQSDLEHQLSEEQFANYRDADRKAYQSGKRVLFIPTFYAIGRVP